MQLLSMYSISMPNNTQKAVNTHISNLAKLAAFLKADYSSMKVHFPYTITYSTISFARCI